MIELSEHMQNSAFRACRVSTNLRWPPYDLCTISPGYLAYFQIIRADNDPRYPQRVPRNQDCAGNGWDSEQREQILPWKTF